MRWGSLTDWIALLRMDRPVGYWLLMWPTLWGLFAASEGMPSIKNLIIFVSGVLIMRSAGCVINDISDRDFDKRVERTRHRPIAAGHISRSAALSGFAILMAGALLLALLLPAHTLKLAIVGAILASLYPLFKRFTYFPQAWLGMSFGWGIIMAWSAEAGNLSSPVPWLLWLANIFWALSYDTAYALADRKDDLQIGVKSTAIFFGEKAILAIVFFGIAVLALLGYVAWELGAIVFAGWLIAALLQIILLIRLWKQGEAGGFSFFRQSHWISLCFLLGLVAHHLHTF